VQLRPARSGDLAGIYDVWHRNQARDGKLPPRGDACVFEHELATGRVVVAEADHTLVGFAAVLPRDATTYLAELFVDPQHQSQGIGRALLERVLAGDRGHVLCTIASTDLRAFALYTRAGMRPRWPCVFLACEPSRLGPQLQDGTKWHEADPRDPELLAWDKRISGRRRSVDLRYWIEREDGTALWFTRAQQTIGFGFVRRRSPCSLWRPNSAQVGPIGATDATQARACVAMAIEYARQLDQPLEITLAGHHPALFDLLEQGFRVLELGTFLSNTPDALDAERYALSPDQL
jgi:GNAT superfamily N-acetyltransferase